MAYVTINSLRIIQQRFFWCDKTQAARIVRLMHVNECTAALATMQVIDNG